MGCAHTEDSAEIGCFAAKNGRFVARSSRIVFSHRWVGTARPFRAGYYLVRIHKRMRTNKTQSVRRQKPARGAASATPHPKGVAEKAGFRAANYLVPVSKWPLRRPPLTGRGRSTSLFCLYCDAEQLIACWFASFSDANYLGRIEPPTPCCFLVRRPSGSEVGSFAAIKVASSPAPLGRGRSFLRRRSKKEGESGKEWPWLVGCE